MVTYGLHAGLNRYSLSAGQITPVQPKGKVRTSSMTDISETDPKILNETKS